MEQNIQKLVAAANSTNEFARTMGTKKLLELGLDKDGNQIKAAEKKEAKPKAERKKREPKAKEEKQKPSKASDLGYDCDDLIAKAEERKAKAKAAAEKRASMPKKTPATKNKEAIEKTAGRVGKNVQSRVKKGDVTVAEIEKLISEYEDAIKNLRELLTKVKSNGKMAMGGGIGEDYSAQYRKIKNHACKCGDKMEKGGLLNYVQNEMPSGTLASKVSVSDYKTLDAIRSKMIEMLMERGDEDFSISNATKLAKDAELAVIGRVDRGSKSVGAKHYSNGGGVDNINIGDRVMWKGNVYKLTDVSDKRVAGMVDKKYSLTSEKVGVQDAILDSLKGVKKVKIIDHFPKYDLNEEGNFAATIDGKSYEIIYRDDVSQMYDLFQDGKKIASDTYLRNLMSFDKYEKGGGVEGKKYEIRDYNDNYEGRYNDAELIEWAKSLAKYRKESILINSVKDALMYIESPDKKGEQIFEVYQFGKGGGVDKVGKVMHEYKEGKLHSGTSSKIVKDRKQAIAIALSEAGMSKKMVKGGGINKKYKYFAIGKNDNKIVNAWELISDVESLKYYAKIDLKDNDYNPKDFKIVSGKFLISQGINPYDNANWR